MKENVHQDRNNNNNIGQDREEDGVRLNEVEIFFRRGRSRTDVALLPSHGALILPVATPYGRGLRGRCAPPPHVSGRTPSCD